MRWLLWGGAAYLLWNFLTDLPEKIANLFLVKIHDLKIVKKDSGFLSTKIVAVLTITNTSQVPVSIKSISGGAYTNGQKIGDIFIPNAMSLTPDQAVSTPIEITATNSELFQVVLISLANLQKPTIDYKGMIDTSIGVIPFTYRLT